MAAILQYIQPKLHALSNGRFANWPPDAAVSVGDYGILKNGAFERLGSLREYGAKFDVKPAAIDAQTSATLKNELEFKDKIELSIGTMAQATIPANQGAKVAVKIRGKGAFLYHLFDVRQMRPVDQREFEDQVAKVLIGSSLALPEGAVLVTEVQHAGRATIIASDHSEGSLELTTSFMPTGTAYLSGAKGGISVSSSAGSMFSWIARGNTVTLLKLVRPRIPPPSGPGDDAGTIAAGLQTVLTWAQGIFKERQLTVADLVIRARPASSDTVVIAFANQEMSLSLADVTPEDMVQTVKNEVEEEVPEPFKPLHVEEQEFGSGAMEA